MAIEFYVHKMSEHMESAEILNWMVKEGDRVEKYQIIMEVLTDKVTAAIESPAEGIIKGIRPGATTGATVPVGMPICYIASEEEEVPALPPLPGFSSALASPTGSQERPSASAVPAGKESNPVPEAKDETVGPVGTRSTPIARRLAERLGVDILQVRGTGPQGRVTESDVRAWAETARTAGQPAETGYLELTPVQRRTGERMLESVANAPQFALELSVNMGKALLLREQLTERPAAEVGFRLSITALLVKASAAALRQHPRVNGEFEGGRLKVHSHVHVAVAVDGEGGLVAPVIRDADRKPLAAISDELRELQEKVRSLRISRDELAGATFTVSNLGMFGVERFQAIINPPQSAILAVGRIARMPVGQPDGSIVLQPMMSLTLTADHRCLDGGAAARFLTTIRDRLESPQSLQS